MSHKSIVGQRISRRCNSRVRENFGISAGEIQTPFAYASRAQMQSRHLAQGKVTAIPQLRWWDECAREVERLACHFRAARIGALA